MSYSVDLRERVVSYARGGGSQTQAVQLFQVGRTTLYRWLNSTDFRPKPARERLRALRHWIAQHGRANMVSFDEIFFDSHTHRPHGWAIRGRRVFGRVSGKHHKRTNLIMAQRGSDWLAPMLFEASCMHLTVTTWIEKMLLPALQPNSLVIMDNAPFHNKPKISQLLATAGHTLMPLPRHSPDFNPIEQAFAILKRQRQFSGREVADLIACHS